MTNKPPHKKFKPGLPNEFFYLLKEAKVFLHPSVKANLIVIIDQPEIIRAYLRHPGTFGTGSKRNSWLDKHREIIASLPDTNLNLPAGLEVQLSEAVKILFSKDERFADEVIPPIVKKETALSLAFENARKK